MVGSIIVNKFKTKSLKMADFDMLQNLVVWSVKEEFFGPVNTVELVTYLEDIATTVKSERI